MEVRDLDSVYHILDETGRDIHLRIFLINEGKYEPEIGYQEIFSLLKRIEKLRFYVRNRKKSRKIPYMMYVNFLCYISFPLPEDTTDILKSRAEYYLKIKNSGYKDRLSTYEYHYHLYNITKGLSRTMSSHMLRNPNSVKTIIENEFGV